MSVTMLRQFSQTLVRTHRAISRSCAAHGEGFKSAYSLERLYPQSNPDITACTHSQEATRSSDTFDGLIPVGKLTVKYSCSSGPGGQNVNKVHTKADVRFHVETASWLPAPVRQSILERKTNQINKAGELIVTSERTRSQATNFADCLQKIQDIVAEVQRKPREVSEEDKAVLRMRAEQNNRQRLRKKRMHSATKNDRKVMFE